MGMNLLFSVDSILTVVGMTDVFAVMVGSVVISVALMLIFAKPLARFLRENPDFEIMGLFVLLLIGFVLFLEGGREAGVSVNASEFPHIPQWIVIFTLMLMFSVDLYQNWWEQRFRKRAKAEYGLDLDLEHAEELRDSFFSAYPPLAEWHQRSWDEARAGVS